MQASTSISRYSGLDQASSIAWPMVLCGGLAIAATDFIYCLLFWSPQGVAPARLLQGIAAGALGKAAFHGGIATALLGAGLQWFIGCCFVLAYAVVAPHLTLLLRHPRRYGIAYGLLLYLVMNAIVVPLSAAPPPRHPQVAWMLTSIPMFAVFGTIAALFAKRALRRCA
ncbi:hypothetical protein J2X04_002014 [Lysobacter niabensis]|uniref:DUF1440 domain-containing protein n=1 Tax=Agrilutibacter niabensis TaxID=380628 RepID=A0ABU1VQ73_9GAMM|nr:hypothetical protein [Lysobacter niabensis]MDR7099633.1 hypothetical protein [Lysobacter niabensis]